MGLEGGEPFGLVARFDINNAFRGLEDAFDMEHNLVDTPLEGCHDMFVHERSPSLVCDDVIPNSLERSHVSTFCSQPSFFPEYTSNVPFDHFKICDSNVEMGNKDDVLNTLGGNVENFESQGYLSGYDAILDSYCIDLEDKPKKIMWSTLFYFSFDFSMALTLGGLILFFVLILMFSHSHACEPHAMELDKLLRVLMASALISRVLTCDGVADAPYASVSRRSYSLGAPRT